MQEYGYTKGPLLKSPPLSKEFIQRGFYTFPDFYVWNPSLPCPYTCLQFSAILSWKGISHWLEALGQHVAFCIYSFYSSVAAPITALIQALPSTETELQKASEHLKSKFSSALTLVHPDIDRLCPDAGCV